MKRFILLLLTAVILLALIPILAFDINVSAETDSQGVTYTLSGDRTYYIVSHCDTYVTEVIIPAEYDGLPVKEIGNWAFRNCDILGSVTIPDSITIIGDYAFYNCYRLSNIEIPDSVVIIGDDAFADCEKLKDIEIPDSVIKIGSYAFSGCSGITSIIIPDSVIYMNDYAFSWNKNITDIYCEAKSQPDGWTDNWNGHCLATVHWGYVAEDESIEDVNFMLGDVNDNSEIDSMDYILLKRAYFGTYSLDKDALKRADVNSNDEIDSMDYILLKRAYFGTYKIGTGVTEESNANPQTDFVARAYNAEFFVGEEYRSVMIDFSGEMMGCGSAYYSPYPTDFDTEGSKSINGKTYYYDGGSAGFTDWTYSLTDKEIIVYEQGSVIGRFTLNKDGSIYCTYGNHYTMKSGVTYS